MRKGFTLIELLIVVAIIGILAAIGATVIPNILGNAKEKASAEKSAAEQAEQVKKMAEQPAQAQKDLAKAKFFPPTPPPALNQSEVDRLVTHVARGEQDEAEAMLRQNPQLALGKGHAVEHCGREFGGITAFQFACWALDWHMVGDDTKVFAGRSTGSTVRGAESKWHPPRTHGETVH